MALSSSYSSSFLLLLAIVCYCQAFVPSSVMSQPGVLKAREQFVAALAAESSSSSTEESSDVFEISVNMPPSNSGMRANLRFDSVLPSGQKSEIVEVRYQIPFGLNVEPQNSLAICTQDGAGGEKVGDILRYTSQWTLGLPQGDGLLTQAAAFSGGLSWQCSMFNVMKAKEWGQVVEALVSNEPSRTDEVVLVFERPLE